MPHYLEMAIGDVIVLVETSAEGDGIASGGELAAFLGSVGKVATAMAEALGQQTSAARVELELGVLARAGQGAVIALDRAKANVHLRVVVEAGGAAGSALKSVPRPT